MTYAIKLRTALACSLLGFGLAACATQTDPPRVDDNTIDPFR